MNIKTFEKSCSVCKFVTEWIVIGSFLLKNGKTKYNAKCRSCGKVSSVHEDKTK